MGVLDLVFPKMCLGCGKEGSYICPKCIAESKQPVPICCECGRASIDGYTHTGCKKKYGLDRLISLWRYEGIVRKAILALKYKFAYEVAQELADYSAKTISDFGNRKITVTPIPLHWYRENWRGFNQSELTARLISQKLGLKFIPDLLVRNKVKKPQVQLGREERLENIKGIFSLNPHYSKLVFNNSVVLFDDVWTTGATIKEAARVLKRNKIGQVWGVTISR